VARIGEGAIREGRNTLIAAPTGSGKTLAAFRSSLDELHEIGPASPSASPDAAVAAAARHTLLELPPGYSHC
jgi:superfamily II DNA/RNA helicase